MAKRLTYRQLKRKIKDLENEAQIRRRTDKERRERERLYGVLEMAGAVCHELSQPLQVLSAYCERCLSALSEGDSMRDEIRGIVEKVDQMAAIVRKLESITSYQTMDYIEGKRIIDIDKACRAA